MVLIFILFFVKNPKECQVPKNGSTTEYTDKTMLGGWVFPLKSLRYSLYRWVPPFYLKCLVILGSFAKGLFGTNMVFCCLCVNNLHIQSTLSISSSHSFYPKITNQTSTLVPLAKGKLSRPILHHQDAATWRRTISPGLNRCFLKKNRDFLSSATTKP